MTRLTVRAPNWVGDLVMATPVLEAASRAFDEVSVLVRSGVAPLLEDAPYPITVKPIESKSHEARLWREEAADAALILTTSLRTAWQAFRAGVPIRAGVATNARRLLLTHSFLPATQDGRRLPTPTAHQLRDAAGLLGIDVPDLHPVLATGPRLGVDERLAEAGIQGSYILATPGAAFGGAKLWPPERFAAALDGLHARYGVPSVVVGAGPEQPLVEAVLAKTTSPAVTVSVSLAELRALVQGAKLLLVGDSGPRWIAAAFDVPCVSVMGPNFPEQTATSLEHARVVRVEGLECAPCLERTCPLGHHRCMTDLPVESVIAAAKELLA